MDRDDTSLSTPNDSFALEVSLPLPRKRLLRHVKTQTSLKTSSKRIQSVPFTQDQCVSTALLSCNSSSQTTSQAVTHTSSNTDRFLACDIEIQAGKYYENDTKSCQTAILMENKGVGRSDFEGFLRDAKCQTVSYSETKGTQVEIGYRHVGCQGEREVREKVVQTEGGWTKGRREIQGKVRELRICLQGLAVQIREELRGWKEEVEKGLREGKAEVTQAVVSELQLALSRAISTHQSDFDLWSSERSELSYKLSLLHSQQSEYYYLNRELEHLYLTAVEDNSDLQSELTTAKDAILTLEKQIFAIRMEAISGGLGEIQDQSEEIALSLQVKVAQYEVEMMNFNRLLAEKDAKIRENQDLIDLLHLQFDNTIKEIDHLRSENHQNCSFYTDEISKLELKLSSARYQLRQFTEGNASLSEEMEELRGVLEEYRVRTEVLTQEKSRVEMELGKVRFEVKNANWEVESLRKSEEKMRKLVREYEEAMQKTRVLQLTTEYTTGETFDSEVQIQQLENEKLELQTQIVDLRSVSEDFKDKILMSSNTIRELQTACELLKIKNNELENSLLSTKNALLESKEQREITEKRSVELINRVNSLQGTLMSREKELHEALGMKNAQDVQVKAVMQVLEQQRNQVGGLGKQLEELQSKYSQEFHLRIEFETHLKQFQTIFDSKEKRFNAEKEELVTLNEQLSSRIDNLVQNLTILEEKNADLKKQNREMENQIEENRVEIENIREELKNEQLKCEEKQLFAISIEKSAEIQSNSLKIELETVKTEFESIKTQLTQANSEISSLKIALNEQKRVNSLQNSEILLFQTQIQTFEREKTVFESQISTLYSENEEILQKTAEIRRLKDEFEAELSTLQCENRRNTDEMECLQVDLSSIRSELSKCLEKLSLSQQNEEKLSQKKEELTERLVWYQSEYEKLAAVKKANIELTEKNLALLAQLRSFSVNQ